MLGLPQVTLFFGGPSDTDKEASIVAASVRTLAAHYCAAQLLEFGVWHWRGEDNPTTFSVRENIQDRVDQKLLSARADLVIVVFRNKLGVAAECHGRAYASSSAYELETALLGVDGRKPGVGLFQFEWTTGVS